MSCSMPPPGDHRQRYEVRFRRADNSEERIFGWCSDPTGGAFFESVLLNPSMKEPFVVDRSTGEVIREDKS